MKRSTQFRRRGPRWCKAVILVATAIALPGPGLVFNNDRMPAQAASSLNAQENPAQLAAEKDPKSPRNTYNSGLIHRLPKDGTWAKYRWDSKREGTNSGGSGFVRISSVGRIKVSGKDCRWIEVKNWREVNKKPQNGWIAKVLVREQDLNRGAGILGHVIQGWFKHADQDPVDFKGASAMGLKASLGGAMDNVKKLKRAPVKSKLGTLDCDGVEGTMSPANPRDRMSAFEVRLHDQAPFGVVTRRWQLKFVRDNNWTVGMTSVSRLIDVGTGAKSELPGKVYDPKRTERRPSSGVNTSVISSKNRSR